MERWAKIPHFSYAKTVSGNKKNDTMEQTDKIITALTEIKNSIDSCDKHALYSKTGSVSSILDRFYKPESAYQNDLKYIRQSLGMIMYGDRDDQPYGPNLTKIKQLFHQLIDSIITEANHLGLPSKLDKTMNKSINIHNSLSQNQQQSQTVNNTILLDAFKESLTGKQFREIEEIVKTEKDPEKAKPKILQKLLSFGENVASDILANLITNPTIWSGFIG